MQQFGEQTGEMELLTSLQVWTSQKPLHSEHFGIGIKFSKPSWRDIW